MASNAENISIWWRHHVRLLIWQLDGFKYRYELLTPTALKTSMLYKNVSFNVWLRYFLRGISTFSLKFHTKSLSIHWKMCILFSCEDFSREIFQLFPPVLRYLNFICCVKSKCEVVVVAICDGDDFSGWDDRINVGDIFICAQGTKCNMIWKVLLWAAFGAYQHLLK